MEVTKTCSKCKITKSLNEFTTQGCVCKNCRNKKAREWRAVNKDKTKKYRKKYDKKIKKWKEEHREHIKEYNKEYNKQYKEKKKRELEIQAAQILANLY